MPPRSVRPAANLALLLAAALLLQLPLALLPGYFSHDELQWAAFADPRCAAWASPPGWGDFAIFQYRPLTFALWHAISPWLFPHPALFHALFALLGLVNALLLRDLLRRLGAGRAADAAALLFLAHPYAVYVHGWVGTLGDLLWVGVGLAAAGVLLRLPARARALPALLGFAATALALTTKEAALSLPALAAVALLLARGERRWWAATIGASLAAAIYLGLRLETLLFAERPGGAYALSAWAAPARVLEYWLFPFLPTRPEIQATLGAPLSRLAFAALLAAAFLGALWRAAPRIAVAVVALGLAALAPVLPLTLAAGQYAYGFAAICAAGAALAWCRGDALARALLAAALLVQAWHAINVHRFLWRAAGIEAALTPALVEHARQLPAVALRIAAADPRDRAVALRLTEPVDCRRGVATALVVDVVDDAPDVDWRIVDGRLQRAGAR